MEFIEVKTPAFVLGIIEKAEQIIANDPSSEGMRHRVDDFVWHTSLNPNRMGGMYLLGYNDYNEFFELSIYSEDNFEIRLYSDFDNAWEMMYPVEEEEND
jgi:hypothetical protein